MKPETREYMNKFENITGVRPKSARIETGSMRGFVRFVLNGNSPVRVFCFDFYKSEENRIFLGVPVTFIDSFHIRNTIGDKTKKNHAEFDVKISDLMGI